MKCSVAILNAAIVLSNDNDNRSYKRDSLGRNFFAFIEAALVVYFRCDKKLGGVKGFATTSRV